MNPGQLEYFSRILTELVIAQAMEAQRVRLAMPVDSPASHVVYFEKALIDVIGLGYEMTAPQSSDGRYLGVVEIHLPRRKH